MEKFLIYNLFIKDNNTYTKEINNNNFIVVINDEIYNIYINNIFLGSTNDSKRVKKIYENLYQLI